MHAGYNLQFNIKLKGDIMLSLGLESLVTKKPVEQPVSLAYAQMSMLVAKNEMDRAYADLYDLTKDLSNYNEILRTVKRHSSTECMEFAADLLGMDVASLEAITADDKGKDKGKDDKDGKDKEEKKPETKAKIAFRHKAYRYWQKFIGYLFRFGRWLREAVKKILIKLHLKEWDGNVKVTFTEKTLDNFVAKVNAKGGAGSEYMHGDIADILQTPIFKQTARNSVTVNGAGAAGYLKKLIDVQTSLEKMFKAIKTRTPETPGESNVVYADNVKLAKTCEKLLAIIQKDVASVMKAAAYMAKKTGKDSLKNSKDWDKTVPEREPDDL